MARRAVERASDETKLFWETRQACRRRTGLREALGEGLPQLLRFAVRVSGLVPGMFVIGTNRALRE
jgi:hypothetical protein